MALWQFEFRLVNPNDTTLVDRWPRGNVNKEARPALERDLREYLGESKSWSPHVIIFGSVDDTDVTLFVVDDGSAEVSARVSMRDSDVDALQRLYAIAVRHGLSIEVDDTRVTSANQLVETAALSSAARFCQSPQRFIDQTADSRPRYVIISNRPTGRLNLMGLMPDGRFYGVYSKYLEIYTNPAANRVSRSIEGKLSPQDYSKVVSLIHCVKPLAAPIPHLGQDGLIAEGFYSNNSNIIFRYSARSTSPEASAAFNEMIDLLMTYVQPLVNDLGHEPS